MKRKPKFKVGQVVGVRGSRKFRDLLPDYFSIVEIAPDSLGGVIYYKTHAKGPWIQDSHARPLTKRERGPEKR